MRKANKLHQNKHVSQILDGGVLTIDWEIDHESFCTLCPPISSHMPGFNAAAERYAHLNPLRNPSTSDLASVFSAAKPIYVDYVFSASFEYGQISRHATNQP